MNTLRFFSTSLIALLLIIIFNVSNSFAMSFEKKLEFCKITSLWLPVIFENAGVNGAELCKVSGGSYCTVTVNNRQLNILEKPISNSLGCIKLFQLDSHDFNCYLNEQMSY